MPAQLKTSQQGDTKLVFATGDWHIEDAVRLDQLMIGLEAEIVDCGARSARIILDQLNSLDTAGAWLLTRLCQRLRALGVEPVWVGTKPHHAALLARIESDGCKPAEQGQTVAHWVRIIEHLGAVTSHVASEAYAFIAFLGSLITALVRSLLIPTRLRWSAISHHIETTGINGLPIVGLMSFLIGIVLAYQGASQLARFGAEIFTIDLLAVSVMRELGILMTAIIVAGRSGSAFTAQIGTMRINQEVDALAVIGMDPMRVLVLPRCLALLVTLPILSIFAVIMAYVGGGLVVILALDIPTIQFFRQLFDAISVQVFVAGMIKAPVFAFVIAAVGCFKGLQVSGSAAAVGSLTTQSVVVSIFLVIVLDAFFSILFAVMGI